jgi:hypothetical protein
MASLCDAPSHPHSNHPKGGLVAPPKMPFVRDTDSCGVPEQGAHANGALLRPVHTEETACGGKRLTACPRDAVYCIRQGTGASFGVQVPGKIVGVR